MTETVLYFVLHRALCDGEWSSPYNSNINFSVWEEYGIVEGTLGIKYKFVMVICSAGYVLLRLEM